MSVSVQQADFDLAAELAALRHGRTDLGALVSFIGSVRDVPLTLEHYPAMTERALMALEAEAAQRFNLCASRLIHRYGALNPGDQIVLVLTASRHRAAAFAATQFLIDKLKTEVPFWKLENGTWVEQRADDRHAARDWQGGGFEPQRS